MVRDRNHTGIIKQKFFFCSFSNLCTPFSLFTLLIFEIFLGSIPKKSKYFECSTNSKTFIYQCREDEYIYVKNKSLIKKHHHSISK